MSLQAPTDVPTQSSIEPWDINAPARLDELVHNDDPAYRALTNYVLRYLQSIGVHRGARILDVGCGLGFLSAALVREGFAVVAIDPSAASIRIARGTHDEGQALRFEAATIQEYAKRSNERYDVILANMTLHAVEYLTSFMTSAAQLLEEEGVLVATIPNPDQYLQTRMDLDIGGMDLGRDNILRIPFRIHNKEPHPSPVFYYHRPIRSYSVAADKARLRIDDFHVPDQIGPGRPRDVTLIAFRPSTPTRDVYGDSDAPQ